MLPDLSYFRERSTGFLFIARFTTSCGHIAARLSYLPDPTGPIQFLGTNYRKVSLHEPLIEGFPVLSRFPADDVYLIPLSNICDIVWPALIEEVPPCTDPDTARFFKQACAQARSVGGRLGFIGSILFDVPLHQANDIDLAIVGGRAWAEMKAFIQGKLRTGEFELVSAQEYPRDQIRREVLGLSHAQFESIRESQWWRHIRIGESLVTLSYSRWHSSHPIDFSIGSESSSSEPADLQATEPPSAPYRLRRYAFEEPAGVATTSWFFRTGFGALLPRVHGKIARIGTKYWLWIDSPNSFVSWSDA